MRCSELAKDALAPNIELLLLGEGGRELSCPDLDDLVEFEVMDELWLRKVYLAVRCLLPWRRRLGVLETELPIQVRAHGIDVARLSKNQSMPLSATDCCHEVSDLLYELGHIRVLEGAETKLAEVISAKHVEVPKLINECRVLGAAFDHAGLVLKTLPAHHPRGHDDDLG